MTAAFTGSSPVGAVIWVLSVMVARLSPKQLVEVQILEFLFRVLMAKHSTKRECEFLFGETKKVTGVVGGQNLV